jgi:hypothetical protein
LSMPDSYNVTKVLSRNLPDILCFVLATGGAQGPMDELSYLLQIFYQSCKLTVPLVLVCEIFEDINFILLDDAQRTYNESLTSALEAEIELRKTEIHQNILEANCSELITRRTLESTKSFIKVLVKDDAVATFRAAHIQPARAAAPFYMLKHHPALCGLLQFHLDRTMNYIGLRLCNEWECCIGVLYLYNAVKSQVPYSSILRGIASRFQNFASRGEVAPRERVAIPIQSQLHACCQGETRRDATLVEMRREVRAMCDRGAASCYINP